MSKFGSKIVIIGVFSLFFNFAIIPFISVYADGGKVVSVVTPTITEQADINGAINTGDEVENKDTGFVVEVDGEEIEGGEKFVIEIEEKGTVILRVKSACSILSEISINTNEAISGEITVTSKEGNPTDVELKDSYGFCGIETQDLDFEKIDSISWRLTASRKDLSDKNIGKDDLAMKLFKDGKWEDVKTKRADGDTENYYYFAETDDFGEGMMALAIEKSTLFSLKNILLCLGGAVILLIVGVVIVLGTQGDKGQKAK